MKRWLLWVALATLYLLRNDVWWWHDPRLVFGLPIGLAYHVLFCFVVSVVMIWLIRVAWPAELQNRDGATSASPPTGPGSRSGR